MPNSVFTFVPNKQISHIAWITLEWKFDIFAIHAHPATRVSELFVNYVSDEEYLSRF